ncbi:phosphatidylglycerophosphatase A family protein [Shewanella litorisediminis]|uniref:Phosphatidylglycerophosphatase A n=1 Tax=Shewanella litorisediminis TaxID=1173586 RepID=A0ABX7G604_9GAMM|nr:phosphatidylglycerophosphatase A [Shewanella litorisediminis]MCL2917643.1 phosphatidylglycerophosphatase A [Shewanella litorisediminis]QRH02766.1 phosphatidylglycerophosphatase A [Shewanella litorisediminis]
MCWRSQDEALSRLSLKNPWHFLALGFGSGLAKKAPGTFGTLAAIPLYLLLSPLPLAWYLLATAIAVVAGVYICDRASKDMGVHDHGAIVWDEVAGLLITMIAAPTGVVWLVAGFVLFRIFDILKPWPIRVLDARVHGGLGIMADDVLAGVFALGCLQGLAYWFAG